MAIRPLTGRTLYSGNGAVVAGSQGAIGRAWTGFRSSWNGNLFFPPPDSGAVLYYPGHPGVGSTITDFSGSGNHGTILGATWTRLPSGLWMLSFDAIDDYVTFGDESTLAWMHGKGNTTAFKWTILAWFNSLTPVALNTQILSTMLLATTGTGVTIFRDTNRKIGIRIGNGSGSVWVFALTSTTVLANNTNFNCVAITYDQSLANTNLNLYLNGVWKESANKTANAPNDANSSLAPAIGYDASVGASNGKNGLNRIYNSVLSASQIAIIFARERHLFGV